MARCKGVTKAGAKCRRTPLNGGEYCAAHDSQGGPAEAAQDTNGAAPPQLEALPGATLEELEVLHEAGVGLPRAIRLQGSEAVSDWCGYRLEELDDAKAALEDGDGDEGRGDDGEALGADAE